MRIRNLTLTGISDALYSAPAVHSATSFFRYCRQNEIGNGQQTDTTTRVELTRKNYLS